MENTLSEMKPSFAQLEQPGQTDHPVIDIPFSAEIGGRQYRGEGLSLVTARIVGLIDPALEGGPRLARLVFAFDGFTVAISVQCAVHGIAQNSGRATLVFKDPAGAHLPQLRHLLNSFIAGDLVSLGPTIGVALAVPAKSRPKASVSTSPAARARRIAGRVGTVALSVILAALVVNMVFERAFTVPVETPASVAFAGQTLAAITSGQIDYLNPDAASGEVAFSIRANSGEILSILMPCDCNKKLAGLQVGATVFAGDPILYLSEKDAPLLISGQLPRGDLIALSEADHVDVQFPDGEVVAAHLDPATLSGLQSKQPDEAVSFVLTPVQALSPAREGQLAELVIVKHLPKLLAPLASLRTLSSRIFKGA